MSNNRSTTFSKGSRSGSTRRVVDHGNGRVETFEDRREKDYSGKVTVRSERTSVQKSDQWFRDQERNADKERQRQTLKEARKVIAKMSGTTIGGQSTISSEHPHSTPPTIANPTSSSVDWKTNTDHSSVSHSVLAFGILLVILVIYSIWTYAPGLFIAYGALAVIGFIVGCIQLLSDHQKERLMIGVFTLFILYFIYYVITH